MSPPIPAPLTVTILNGISGKPEGEDPDEDAKILAALEAQGYFRPEAPLSCTLQGALHTACERHGVGCAVALGLIQVESGFDPESVKPNSGCYGLMQLSPRFFRADMTPAENLEAGIAYLGAHLERYGGDIQAALTAYHDGSDTGRRGYAQAVTAATWISRSTTASSAWSRTAGSRRGRARRSASWSGGPRSLGCRCSSWSLWVTQWTRTKRTKIGRIDGGKERGMYRAETAEQAAIMRWLGRRIVRLGIVEAAVLDGDQVLVINRAGERFAAVCGPDGHISLRPLEAAD